MRRASWSAQLPMKGDSGHVVLRRVVAVGQNIWVIVHNWALYRAGQTKDWGGSVLFGNHGHNYPYYHTITINRSSSGVGCSQMRVLWWPCSFMG